jgi:hypothetical protein
LDGVSLDPKPMKKSKEVLKWKRPKNSPKINFQRKWWTKDDDNFILNNSIKTSIKKLNRTYKSIYKRLYKLKK